MGSEININNTDFKALSANTRVKILKLLSQKKYTQSDLAEILKLSIPSIKEHLDLLVKTGFIEKLEEGRKWKYYSATDKTKSLFHSELYKFVITLGIFIIIAGITFVNSFTQTSGYIAEKSLDIASEAAIISQESNLNMNLLPLTALVFLILTIYFWIKYKKAPHKILRSLPK